MWCGLAPGDVGAVLRLVVHEVHGTLCAQLRKRRSTHRLTPHTFHTGGLWVVDWPIPGACREAVSCVASLWRMAPRHPASHAPKPDAPCCRGLGVRSLVPCAGLGRGRLVQEARQPGQRAMRMGQVVGPQWVGHAARPIPRGPPGTPPRIQHGCWIAHCAVACGRCLQTTCGRGRGGCTAQQRCGVAAAPVAVAVLRLRPPGRRCWPGVPPWRCRRAGRGC